VAALSVSGSIGRSLGDSLSARFTELPYHQRTCVCTQAVWGDFGAHAYGASDRTDSQDGVVPPESE